MAYPSMTSFSWHAFQRCEERLTIPNGDVARILDMGLWVPIGVEPGTHRHHRLFYSDVDSQCFVAVQDDRDGLVITILPLDYHVRVAWPVALDAQEAAMHLVRPDLKAARMAWLQAHQAPAAAPPAEVPPASPPAKPPVVKTKKPRTVPKVAPPVPVYPEEIRRQMGPVPEGTPDLTGVCFGRFQVIGLCRKDAGGGWWAQCACGAFERRRGKAVRNPLNRRDACPACRAVDHSVASAIFLAMQAYASLFF